MPGMKLRLSFSQLSKIEAGQLLNLLAIFEPVTLVIQLGIKKRVAKLMNYSHTVAPESASKNLESIL